MNDITDQRRFVWQSLIPSSVLSVCVHLLILIIAGSSLRGCEEGVLAQAGGPQYRDIGLTVIPDASDQLTDVPEENPTESEVERPSVQTPSPRVPQEAPTVADLLDRNSEQQNPVTHQSPDLPQTIGPGHPLSGLNGIPELIRPAGTSGRGAAGSPTPGPGATSFMEIADRGTSFVYVIDTSSSMADGRRLPFAKSRLIQSLRMLQPNQKFQVLFYSEFITQMRFQNRSAQNWYPATTVNVNLAAAEIERVHAERGTEHLPALLHALRLNPDVVYFLTDGREPSLSASELAAVQKANSNRAHIHVIEIGSGPRETRDLGWLYELAHRSGGKYKYARPQAP